MSNLPTVDRAAIVATEALIRPHVRRTPVVEVDGADFGLDGCALSFKLELLQRAGVFKTRGAFTNLLRRAVPPAGVVAASGGNHGAAGTSGVGAVTKSCLAAARRLDRSDAGGTSLIPRRRRAALAA